MMTARRTPSWFHMPIILMALAAVLHIPADAARDNALAIDLSEDLIGISTGFTGASVLLFGATEGEGSVIVLVRSPNSRVVVRRKSRVAGIWVNSDELTFDDAPGFYHAAASASLEDLLPDDIRRANQIGVNNIGFKPHAFLSADEEKAFRMALIRNKQRSGLYSTQSGRVTFEGPRLFRTRLELPANVPTGKYAVEVFLVNEGQIVGRSTRELSVRKVGLEAKITEFAFEQAPLYGIIAVLIALIAGWFAGFVFRKV